MVELEEYIVRVDQLVDRIDGSVREIDGNIVQVRQMLKFRETAHNEDEALLYAVSLMLKERKRLIEEKEKALSDGDF